MRTLVVIEFLSLDGVMQAPGAPDEDTEGGFQHGGWQRPYSDDVLGATAAQNLLETKLPIGKLRGHFHDYLGVKVMPTFHPAYLLRDPHKKREVWEDMKIVRDYLNSVK